jgi:hypothetical protein
MSSPSSVLTRGLGLWGSPSLLLTRGLGDYLLDQSGALVGSWNNVAYLDARNEHNRLFAGQGRTELFATDEPAILKARDKHANH